MAYYRDVLSLNTRETPLQVTWKLDDNGGFIRLVEERYPDLDFAELVALRRYLAEAERVDGYFSDDMVAKNALQESRRYAETSLKAYDLKEIVKTLFQFYRRNPDADIFGRMLPEGPCHRGLHSALYRLLDADRGGFP